MTLTLTLTLSLVPAIIAHQSCLSIRHLDGVVHGAGDELQVVGARQEADAEQVGLVPRVNHNRRSGGLRVVPDPDLEQNCTRVGITVGVRVEVKLRGTRLSSCVTAAPAQASAGTADSKGEVTLSAITTGTRRTQFPYTARKAADTGDQAKANAVELPSEAAATEAHAGRPCR